MSMIEMLRTHFQIQDWQAENVMALIDAGNTIPFIARYRKEMTGNMDDQLLRQFEQKLQSLRALTERRAEVCRLIEEQDQLSEALRLKLEQAKTVTEIDDIYRPFRPKRKTRGSVARDRGLQPLAELLLQPEADFKQIMQLAGQLAGKTEDVPDADSALAGSKDILAEQLSDNADLRSSLRTILFRDGTIHCRIPDKDEAASSVYAMYADYTEPINRIPGHRILAINRGEREKQLSVRVELAAELAVRLITGYLPRHNTELLALFQEIAEDAWKRLLFPSLTTELRSSLTERAEEGAMDVFAENLRSLLLQPPIRNRVILAVDPGFRTGCKIAIVDQTGRVLDTGVIYPTPPHNQTDRAGSIVLGHIEKFQVNLIAIGNGTASRETERFIGRLLNDQGIRIPYLLVNESGASVYSASPEAAAEFPDFDVSLRSAVSIARRVQDPLAELVKIEPRSIGVGQYQHDMSQKKLDDELRGVVESCVNQVGVDLNTASAALLTYVAGMNTTTAKNVISYREKNGAFKSRRALLDVPRMGPKAFEQSAGFLRIPGAAEILDNTSIHPEAYKPVYALSLMLECPPSPELARKARQQPSQLLADRLGLGLLTYQDILDALARPGRDPRDDLPQPTLRSDVLEIEDLQPGMVLQGVVRNVADFGAFVDIGVHQDGLVHISELADQFVKRPMDIVRTGQAVNVSVIQVDAARKRISLTMKGIKQPEPELKQ